MRYAGPHYTADGKCKFTIWAPEKESMILHLVHPRDERIPMHKGDYGYFSITLENIKPGTRYYYMPDGEKDFPDPASHYQPEGVHGPSEIVDHNTYEWTDATWRGLPQKELILYELHTGTFTPEGTFEAIIPRLDELRDLGVTALELMPVCQFPGSRNWGYDAVYPYAVHESYGGPEGLKKLVDACHAKGIAVFLDVVYNHLGPEGNYFPQFAPYFTNKYCTPWGDALNFDGDWSDGVRDYFAGNALYWFQTYHIDGLRLDAIHMVFDTGAVHFWEYANNKIDALQQELGRPLYMIAESDLNSPRVVGQTETGGLGFDMQWLDDFHHALYVLLHPEGKERYEDFGELEQLAKAYKDGFVHSGDYVKFRKRKYGLSSAGVRGNKFVVFNQNHDQVGNRVKGERLCMLVDIERQKLAAAAILLSPYIPMLFMGEEYADKSPFFYFISHSDKELIKAVQKGRKEEFANYKWDVEPPDPQAEETFRQCILNWEKRHEGKHDIMWQWHKELIRIRHQYTAMQNDNKDNITVGIIERSGLYLQRKSEDGNEELICVFNFSDSPICYPLPKHSWTYKKLLDSTEQKWQADNKPNSEVLPDELLPGESISIGGTSVLVLLAQSKNQ